MARDALVVGINQYPFLKDTPTSKAKHLTTPAFDAEEIAQLLENYGDFQVRRLPGTNQDGKLRVDPKKPVKLKELQDTISEFFQPKGHRIPETAVLFFAGHGFRRTWEGRTEGYLVTSDTGSSKVEWGLSLQWLRQLLRESPVRQQVIWLDCCNSGELLNFLETDLGEYERGRDRCFIVASRDFQVAYEAAEGNHGVLSGTLLQGLDPTLQAEKWVTNYSLVDFVKQALKDAPQHPICTNSGGQIILTGKQSVISSTCPYKGLAYFDFNEEDPKYFYGRTALTNQLLEKVHCNNFLAVLGASGSGKSSVVRAGLLHNLKLGEAIPGSDRWKIYEPFTPGEHPLQSLERVIGIKEEQIEALIKAAAAERIVLTIDQFEEAFTLCRDEMERQQFFEYLMRALEDLGNKLCLVLAMRSDFFGKCTEKKYAGLAKTIEQNLVTVLPMSQEELREAIVLPAAKVGLEIDRELVTEMIADVEGSPGDLPLLQYTLTELWQHKILNRLTISDYTRLGRVKKALEKRTNEVYQSLTREWQLVAKRIFLDLTRLAEDEDTEDTRQPILLQDLVSTQQSEELVNQVLQRLVNAKLVVTDKQELEGKPVAIVNIAHEALIRHWQQLRDWLKEDRSFLLWHQELRFLFKAWVSTNFENPSQRDKDKLLRGNDLRQAEKWLIERQADLSSAEQAFIDASREWQQLTLSRRLAGQAENIRLQQPHLLQRSVLLAMEAMKRFPCLEAEQALRYGLALLPLPVIHVTPTDRVDKIIFSLDSKYIATVNSKNFVQVWDATTGEEIARLEHQEQIRAVAFSPDSKYLTTADNHSARVWEVASCQQVRVQAWKESISTRVALSPDGKFLATVCEKLVPDEKYPSISRAQHITTIWDLTDNQLVKQILNAGGDVLNFSPDGKYLALAGVWGTSWVWETMTGKEVARVTTPIGGADTLSFSPDGRYFAIAGWNCTVKIWEVINGQEIPHISQGRTRAVTFSPDGKYLATASDNHTACVWEVSSGQKVVSMTHEEGVNAVSFSPDGVYLVTLSDDRIARVWEVTNAQEVARITDIVETITFSLDGQLATVSLDGRVWVWEWTIPASRKVTRLCHPETLWKVAWNHNGQYLSTASDAARVWEISSGKEIACMKHEASVNAVAFSPNGKYLGTASQDNTAGIWEAISGREVLLRLRHESPVKVVVFSPNEDYLATGSDDQSARIWDMVQGREVARLKHDARVRGVIFSRNGRYLATASGSVNTSVFKDFFSLDDTAQVWEVPSGKHIARMTHEHQGNVMPYRHDVNAIAFSPDDKYLATASNDGTARLWEVISGKEIKHLLHTGKVKSVAFSPNGEYLATASDNGTARVWDVTSGQEIVPPLSHGGSVNAVAFNPNGGKYLATASDDSTARIWEVSSGKQVVCLRHETVVWSVSFSPDEKYLVTVTANATAQLWRWLLKENLLTEACTRLTRNLTQEEWERYLPGEPYHKTCLNLPD